MLKKIITGALAATFLTGALAGNALAEKQTIKFALIEGLSGPFAANGQAALRELKYSLNKYVANDKINVEVIGLDNKNSAEESLSQLKKAIDQGATYIVQGNSSSVAQALLNKIVNHNKRNPKKRVVFLNHSAAHPSLTEESCSYWHFRFDTNIRMKLAALIGALASNTAIKKVYIIGQDYSFGQAVSKSVAGALKRVRPDIKIVGNELHPFGKVKDFSPYAQKIKKSGADAIVTGNWGSDMLRLAKSIGDANIESKVFTFYAGGTGTTAAIGKDGVNKILVVSEGSPNPMTAAQLANWKVFKSKYPDNDIVYQRMPTMARMLNKAIEKAGSTKPFEVAKALRGMKIQRMDGSEAVMRADDHQILINMNVLAHTDKLPKYEDKLVNDFDKSGFGLVSTAAIPAARIQSAVKCKMKVPSK